MAPTDGGFFCTVMPAPLGEVCPAKVWVACTLWPWASVTPALRGKTWSDHEATPPPTDAACPVTNNFTVAPENCPSTRTELLHSDTGPITVGASSVIGSHSFRYWILQSRSKYHGLERSATTPRADRTNKPPRHTSTPSSLHLFLRYRRRTNHPDGTTITVGSSTPSSSQGHREYPQRAGRLRVIICDRGDHGHGRFKIMT